MDARATRPVQSPKRAAGSDEFMLPLSIENLNPDVASRNVRPRPLVNPTMRNMTPPAGLSGFESPRERNIVDRLDLHPSPTPRKRSRSNSASSHRARGMDRETAHRGNPSTRDSGRGRSGDPASIIGRDPLNADTLINVFDGIKAFQKEFNRSSGSNVQNVCPTANAASFFVLDMGVGALANHHRATRGRPPRQPAACAPLLARGLARSQLAAVHPHQHARGRGNKPPSVAAGPIVRPNPRCPQGLARGPTRSLPSRPSHPGRTLGKPGKACQQPRSMGLQMCLLRQSRPHTAPQVAMPSVALHLTTNPQRPSLRGLGMATAQPPTGCAALAGACHGLPDHTGRSLYPA